MANGKWTRYGRGSCEGYALSIGYGFFSFRAGVVRNVITMEQPSYTWRADLFGHSIGDAFADRDAGFDKVEAELHHSMRLILEDWSYFEKHGRSSIRNVGKKGR